MESKKAQLIDLLIVLSVSFLPAIIRSFYVLYNGAAGYNNDTVDIAFITGSVQSTLSILLMFYVLSIRNETYRDLGIVINLREVGYGIGLFMLAYLTYYITWLTLSKTLPSSLIQTLTPKNTGFLYQKLSIFLVVYVLVNPFFEELIVRGFTMTRLSYLTNNKIWIIGISVLIQFSYHLYQGVLPAFLLSLTFLIFSIFYFKTGRLTPVIVAHFIFDFLILLKH